MPSCSFSSIRREQALRQKIRTSLADWAESVLAPLGQHPAAHHRLLMAELEGLSAGRTQRLMVLMPPGAAKSTYASVLFPAWWFTQHPRSAIIAATHTADLAQHFGRQVRALIDTAAPRLGYALRPDDRAARRFATTTGGQYFATGVRGPIVGRRADLAIIDDPVKAQGEADRAALRDGLHEWFRADLLSRLKPRGRVLLVMTRWHRDDLAGRLLAAGDWRVLRLPALAEADDPLGRMPGVPLWPEWEDAVALAQKRAAVGERVWSALYQQAPRGQGGALFRLPRVQLVDAAPSIVQAVRAWDLAATAGRGTGDPDWTVGVKLGRTDQGGYVVLDVVRLQGEPAAVEEAIRAAAQADGPAVPIGLPQDPGQAGRAQVLYLTRQLAGYTVRTSPETGSKLIRASPVASQANAGNLAVVQAAWTAAFLEELADFPHGAKDDQVDALSRSFAMLTEAPAATRRTRVPLLAR